MSGVYFAKKGELLKVGCSSQIEHRLTTLGATWIAAVKMSTGHYKAERIALDRLREFHVKGEWHRLCPESLAIVDDFVLNPPRVRGSSPQAALYTDRITVPVNDEELATITANAERSGLKVSTYLRVRGLEA